MKSYSYTITTNWSQLIDFTQICPMPFQLKIFNYDGPKLEFAFGNPNSGAEIELFVPECSTQTYENRPCIGQLWGRAIGTNSTVQIEYS